MDDAKWVAVDRYVEQTLLGDDAVLRAALADGVAAGLPQIQVMPAHGKMLMLLARACGARRILEVGTLGGYSTIWLARGLAAGGSLVTLEVEPNHAAVALRNLERAGFGGGVVEVIVGRAIDTLPKLTGPFDLIFLDADKAGYADYFEWAMRLSRPGTLIIADNVVRKGAVVDAQGEDPNVQGVRRFLEKVRVEPRIEATVVQTVGSKGYDGMMIGVVR